MAPRRRTVVRRFPGTPTLEGAGVRLRRSFSNGQVPLFDPFLLLDNFGSSNPDDYMAGFPWHPHRGIETVTYMLEGRVAHGDTLGNSGVIDAGDVQWMTAGSGIIHQEMPERAEGRMSGFQLWVNLPARQKMDAPAYRGLGSSEIPQVETDRGNRVKVVAGSFGKAEGPVAGLSVDPTYLDVRVPAGGTFEFPTRPGYTAFAHTIEGSGRFDADGDLVTSAGETLLYGPGDTIRIDAADAPLRFLFVSGRPLHEPVAWYGPIVMNSQAELAQAARELRSGEFIKHPRPIDEA
jgi:redox-sensitive bicupin YhaK (pirin superfamily)